MSAKYISPNLPSMIRNLYRDELGENSIQTMLDLAADLVQELIDLRAEQGEAEWEYVGRAYEASGFMRIQKEHLTPGEFERWRNLMAIYPRVEILKRVRAVKAGPWLPVTNTESEGKA